MTIPHVSVILPVFNRLEFLRSAVDSVLAQTLSDWELIIADDGSEAETAAYLGQLESLPRVTLIRLEHSGNPSAVRNAAVREARGKYVAFLDSDDVWDPAKLARQTAVLEGPTNRRWIYTGYVQIDEAGDPTDGPADKPWVPYDGWIFEPLLRLDASVATAAVLVERELLTQAGGFDEALLLFEHYDLWLRLARRSEIELIDEPLTQLRVHRQHYSRAGVAMAAGRYRLLQKMRREIVEPTLHRLIDDLSARSALELASLCAETSRVAAWNTLAGVCWNVLRTPIWRRGLPRLLLKLALPRRLRRSRRRPKGPAAA